MVLLFVWPPFEYINQHKNMNTNSEATEVNEEELQAQVGAADKEIDAMEAFKVCHTSRKKGMSTTGKQAMGTGWKRP